VKQDKNVFLKEMFPQFNASAQADLKKQTKKTNAITHDTK